jgi:hypothetical protein
MPENTAEMKILQQVLRSDFTGFLVEGVKNPLRKI